MQSQDYHDWSKISGLYITNTSHADRYRTYQPLLSGAGLTVVVICDFLENAGDPADPTTFRSSLYEFGDDLQQRLKFTSDALAAVGAPKMADGVLKAKSNSPFGMLAELGEIDPEQMFSALTQGRKAAEKLSRELASSCESRDQIAQRLESFAQAHAKELAADLARHGDPRTQPGYDRAKRIAELAALRRRQWLKETQLEKAQELSELTTKLTKALAKAGDDPKALKRAGSQRREFKEKLAECREIEAADRGDELNKALDAAEQLIASRADFFHVPVTKDEELNARLAALGAFDADVDSDPCELKWDAPEGFSGAWGEYRLEFTYPLGKSKILAKMVDAAERIRDRLPGLSAHWHSQLIENFRDVYEMDLDEDDRSEYAVDESGSITDASIIEHAGRGTIAIEHEDGETLINTFFPADWEGEHGYDLEWDDKLTKAMWKGK